MNSPWISIFRCRSAPGASAAFIAGVKANFPNAKITFEFHVIKLLNEAVDEVRRASIVRLEAANPDTMQAWRA